VHSKFAKLLVVFACIGTMQVSARVLVSTGPVIQQDAPVQIVSIEKTLQNQVADIELKNTSDRPVSGVQIGWAIDVPSGCASVPVATQVNQRSFPLSIAPNATAALKDPVLKAGIYVRRRTRKTRSPSR